MTESGKVKARSFVWQVSDGSWALAKVPDSYRDGDHYPQPEETFVTRAEAIRAQKHRYGPENSK